MRIVHIDNHLLAVDKPAGVPSQPDASGDPSLVDLARDFLKQETGKTGEVYLALLHRLDRPTSGLVLLSRTSKAATRMAELFRRREIGKEYLAVVECLADPGSGGRLEHFLAPMPGGGMRAYRREKAGTRRASLSYRTLASAGSPARALLSIDLETGVKHQIRAQLALMGLPVVGDFRYGPFGQPAKPEPVEGGRAILLHARRLVFVHPVQRVATTLTVPPPEYWGKWGRELAISNY